MPLRSRFQRIYLAGSQNKKCHTMCNKESCVLILNNLESMAEREGFEPPVPLRVRLISSQVHSTGLCHLSALLTSFN
jgi:hypothetical protein